MSILGNRVLRTEDERMLTVGAQYVADLKLEGRAHACFVRSTVASGRPVSVDADEARAHATKTGDGPLAASSEFEQGTNTYAFGCHVAAVEVDSHTGKVTLRRLAACDDAGIVINPLIVEGQVHGGIAQGVGARDEVRLEGQVHGGIAQGVAQVLLEDMVYDSDANPLTANLFDYPAISATELPNFDLVPMETPTPLNPLGAKGIGESGTVGAGAAVLNAVCDALGRLGIHHIDMPATPWRMWQALRQLRTQPGAATAAGRRSPRDRR